MAKANGGRRGAGTRGKYGRCLVPKRKRKPGRPRKARRPLTSAFVELRQLPAPTPEEEEARAEREATGDVDDVAEEESTAHEREKEPE